MKLIGLEFRVGMDGFVDTEVLVVPLNIVFPFPFSYPHGPKANVTLHTSRGDVGAEFSLRDRLQGFNGTISSEEIKKHFEDLRAQIEKLHV